MPKQWLIENPENNGMSVYEQVTVEQRKYRIEVHPNTGCLVWTNKRGEYISSPVRNQDIELVRGLLVSRYGFTNTQIGLLLLMANDTGWRNIDVRIERRIALWRIFAQWISKNTDLTFMVSVPPMANG